MNLVAYLFMDDAIGRHKSNHYKISRLKCDFCRLEMLGEYLSMACRENPLPGLYPNNTPISMLRIELCTILHVCVVDNDNNT